MEGTPKCIIKWKIVWGMEYIQTFDYMGIDLEGYWKNWLYWFPLEKRTRQLGEK